MSFDIEEIVYYLSHHNEGTQLKRGKTSSVFHLIRQVNFDRIQSLGSTNMSKQNIYFL